MARLRRSKLAAGFLLLFQCLSERCQLAGGETPRQSRGKRGRYLPGGGRSGQRRGARGSAAGAGRVGSGEGRDRGRGRGGGVARDAFPQHRRGVCSGGGSAGRVAGEGKRRSEGWLPLLPREARGGRGPGFSPFPPPERALRYFIFLY